MKLYRSLYLRPDRDLPFYCQPLKLFLTVWLVMLIALTVHISYDSYPGMELPIALFSVSALALFCGYGFVRFFFPGGVSSGRSVQYTLDVSKLRRLNEIFALLALSIMLLNLKIDGPPPALWVFSFDTKFYLEYGRLKQLLFPLLITIVVNSFLDPSRFRKILFSAFGLLSMLLYITRGEILAALLQTFFVFSMTTKLNRRKLFFVAGLTVAGLALLADVIGNNRTVEGGLLEYLQIRNEFWGWPTVFIWVISYFSIPFSNLCWIVRDFHFHTVAFSFLYPTLPAFWTPTDPHATILGNSHVIDGVHTYLANYYMDFSFAGILLANFALGVASTFLMQRGITRYFLTSAVFLGCMAYIFFVDNFAPLSTLLQVGMQIVAQRYFLLPARGRIQVRREALAS